jgi:hypothetical protein
LINSYPFSLKSWQNSDKPWHYVRNAAIATLLNGASRILRISSDKIRVFTDEPDDEVIKWLTSA